ncbi:hypothetical protein DMP46_003888 [Escherichia coli]|nr:hypothetical protein [Escherichia coli]
MNRLKVLAGKQVVLFWCFNLLIIVLRAAAALVNALIAILELIRQFID